MLCMAPAPQEEAATGHVLVLLKYYIKGAHLAPSHSERGQAGTHSALGRHSEQRLGHHSGLLLPSRSQLQQSQWQVSYL